MEEKIVEFQKLSDYISYFETIDAENACRWQKGKLLKDGSRTFGYPVYEDRLLQFIDDVSNSNLMDYAYSKTIQTYGLEMNDTLAEQIETADLPLANAILT